MFGSKEHLNLPKEKWKKKLKQFFKWVFAKDTNKSIYLQFITNEKNSWILFILKKMLLDKVSCVYTQNYIPFYYFCCI